MQDHLAALQGVRGAHRQDPQGQAAEYEGEEREEEVGPWRFTMCTVFCGLHYSTVFSGDGIGLSFRLSFRTLDTTRFCPLWREAVSSKTWIPYLFNFTKRRYIISHTIYLHVVGAPMTMLLNCHDQHWQLSFRKWSIDVAREITFRLLQKKNALELSGKAISLQLLIYRVACVTLCFAAVLSAN